MCGLRSFFFVELCIAGVSRNSSAITYLPPATTVNLKRETSNKKLKIFSLGLHGLFGVLSVKYERTCFGDNIRRISIFPHLFFFTT